jgi:hypothetical protein
VRFATVRAEMRVGRRAVGAVIVTVVVLWSGTATAAPQARVTSEAQLDPVYNQAIARYDAKTLAFVDAVTVPQHEASFVTVDPKTMIAYSLDRFGGDALLRYDVRKGWKQLTPLRMSQFVDRVQGGDVAAGTMWLSTDDDANMLYRVALRGGRVQPLGSAGHVDGEGEGIDATKLRSGRLHVLTVDVMFTPVWLGNLAVSG